MDRGMTPPVVQPFETRIHAAITLNSIVKPFLSNAG